MFGLFSSNDDETEPTVIETGTEKISERSTFDIATVEVRLTDGSTKVKQGMVYGLKSYNKEPLVVKNVEIEDELCLNYQAWLTHENIIYCADRENILDVTVTDRRTLVAEGKATLKYEELSNGNKQYVEVVDESFERYFKESDDADS